MTFPCRQNMPRARPLSTICCFLWINSPFPRVIRFSMTTDCSTPSSNPNCTVGTRRNPRDPIGIAAIHSLPPFHQKQTLVTTTARLVMEPSRRLPPEAAGATVAPSITQAWDDSGVLAAGKGPIHEVNSMTIELSQGPIKRLAGRGKAAKQAHLPTSISVQPSSEGERTRLVSDVRPASITGRGRLSFPPISIPRFMTVQTLLQHRVYRLAPGSYTPQLKMIMSVS